MKMKRIILVLVLFFLVGATASIPYGFLTKWGVESVYAKNGNDQGEDDNGGNTVAVPEPSTLLLLGSGLLGLGLLRRKFKK